MNNKRAAVVSWLVSILLGGFCFLVYVINRADPIGMEDTIPAEELPFTILRGDGPYLDRFRPLLEYDRIQLATSMTRSKDGKHLLSRYAPGAVVLNLPLVAVQLAVIDQLEEKGWDEGIGRPFLRTRRMTKVSSGFLVALTVVFLHQLLRKLGVTGGSALLATLAAGLGSELWSVGSQAPWEHGPAALMFTIALYALTPTSNEPTPPKRLALVLSGFATAMMVCCRPLDLIFAVGILLAVLWNHPRQVGWFLPGPILLGTALLGYNLWFFGNWMGGLRELESLHPEIHGLAGPWSGSFVGGFLGTLFSPNRGLLIFCPWVAIGLAALSWTWPSLKAWRPGLWLLGTLVVFLGVISKYAVWWGGHSYGPRYWTEVTPLLAILFGLALGKAPVRGRWLSGVATALVGLAITLQAVGAFCFPSSWNDKPANVDLHPERLWSWTDTEVQRCLIEGAKRWSDHDDPLWHFPGRDNGNRIEMGRR